MKLLAVLATALCAVALAAAPAQAAPRVAALTPFAASTITRLGVRPVVIGQTLGGNDQYLASLRGVPVLTLSHPLGPNLEQLATHNPSIVLSSKTWQRGTPAMRRMGMKVYESDPTSVAAIGRETRAIGGVLGRTRAANALASKIEADVAAAKRGISRRPRVLVILGVGRTPYAMLANSWGGDVVRQAGGNLLTAGADVAERNREDLRRDRGPAQPGHHHRRARTARPATSRASPPTTATTRTGATRARSATAASTSPPATRCCSRIRASPPPSATSVASS